MASQLSTQQCDREKYLSITQWLRMATEGNNPPDLRAVHEACEQILWCWNTALGQAGKIPTACWKQGTARVKPFEPPQHCLPKPRL